VAATGRGRRIAPHAMPTADETAAVDCAITTRRSMRAFLPTPVPQAMVQEILDVASRALSGTNMRPWHVHAVAGAHHAALSAAVLHAHDHLCFDAPVGLFFTIDRGLERGRWLDYGMFLQNVMVAARARGLDTCPQAAFLKFHRVIARELALPANEMLVCGMSLGYADPDAPENRFVTERAPAAAFARFVGFD